MPICSNCHHAIDIARPMYCPNCGRRFVPLLTSSGVEVVNIPPPPAPSSPSIKTSKNRAVAVTFGVGSLVLIAIIVFYILITYSDGTAFFRLITGPANPHPPAIVFRFQEFVALLTNTIPMIVIVAYWFSLRRLFQEWAGRVWIKTSTLTLCFAFFFLTVQGTQFSLFYPRTDRPNNWVLVFMETYPAAIILVIVAALAAGGAGILFGRWFAQWPIERIRALRSTTILDMTLTFLVGFLTLFIQYLIYETLDKDGRPFIGGGWWIPLASIGVAMYAGWAALRPKHT